MSSNPYISFIACSRNDNHGGDLTRRMQIFVDCLSEQCDRHKLRAELVLVEWNPPPDRRPLAEELRWRKSDGFCDVRTITVPPEIHKRYKCAEGLPLFQMIAKNVGIRRARGEFILCTNIDIVFSDELMDFLAKKELAAGCFYRSIRMDADEKVPEGKPVSEVLEYCKNHVIRANLPRYSFEFPSQDELSKSGVIRSPDLSLTNGGDFIRFHEHGSVLFAGTGTQILLDPSQRKPLSGNVLVLEVATTNQESQAASQAALEIEFSDKNGELVYEASLSGRKTIAFEVPFNAEVLALICRGASEKISNNQKSLPLCILKLGWINHIPFESVDYDCYNVGDSIHILGDVQSPQVRYGGRRGISRNIIGEVHLQLSARDKKQTLVFFGLDSEGKPLDQQPTIKFNGSADLNCLPFVTGHWSTNLPECSSQNYVTISYPEMGSWYLTDVHVSDSLIKDCWNVFFSTFQRALKRKSEASGSTAFDVMPANFELDLVDADLLMISGSPVRGVGSPFFLRALQNITEGRILYIELMPSLPLKNQINEIQININGKIFQKIKNNESWLIEFKLPSLYKNDRIEIELKSNFVNSSDFKNGALQYLKCHAFIWNMGWKNENKYARKSLPQTNVFWYLFPDPTDVMGVRNPLDFNEGELPDLFTNACGDFTLAKKNVWEFVDAYPELDLFSMHLDSVLLYTFHYAGFRQETLPASMTHYHIEHGAGWTPEGNRKMYLNLRNKNIPWLGFNHDVMKMALLMRRHGRPVSFNSNDWGMLNESLKETIIPNY